MSLVRPLRLGVAGLRRGAALLRVLARDPRVIVTACCDLDPVRLEAVATEFAVPTPCREFTRFLEAGLDLVVVATPMGLHAEQSIAALQSGAHVLSEVPAVASLAEAEALVAAAREARGLYMLAENCCYWAFVESWSALVAAGRLGDPMYAEAEYVHDCRSLMRERDGSLNWRTTLPPIQYCTHSLGPLLKIMGGRCTRAMGLNGGSRLSPQWGTLDFGVGLFQTDRNVPIRIFCAFGIAREPSYHAFTVYGTRGCLERPRQKDETLAYFEEIPEMTGMATLPLGIRHARAPAHATAGGHGTAEWAMVRAFLDAIEEGRPSPIDVHAGLAMTLPGLCAHESALRGGMPIEIPDTR
ncbi:MAG: Gfo/Idh/MocA family oxidoreductase [Armatimonadetes bacterium]|nr:Gfo/Idh/MocA family oxidoreductase [Armatimonadota bacterium]